MSEENVNTILEFSEDITDAPPPTPLPKRQYRATVKAAVVKVSNNSGKKYCQVNFYISPDQYPADFDVSNAPEGKTIAYRSVPAENDITSKFRLSKFLKAIGAPGGSRLDLNEWVNRDALVEIDHEEYEGVTREVIKSVTAA